MTQLEALDRVDHGRVVDIARLELGRQIVAHDQPPAQQSDVGPAGPGRELGIGRQRGPAAAHFNSGIAEQRLFDALVGALVEHRLG